MLKLVNIDIDLISNQTAYIVVEKSRRCGLPFVGSKRNVNSNIKYIGSYNSNEPLTLLFI